MNILVPKAFETEAALAGAVMAWLEADGWDCYPEVQTGAMGARADIVAVYQQKLVWIIEAKMSLSLDVLDQAQNWIGRAHFVSIAVPRPKRQARPHHIVWCYLRDQGIGLLRCNPWAIQAEREPRLFRRCRAQEFIEKLHPDMKRYQPGTQAGYSTPYRRTMDQVKRFIERNPGCTIKEIMGNVNHHYSSDSTARSCIRVALATFDRQGIRTEQDGKTIRYFLDTEAVKA